MHGTKTVVGAGVLVAFLLLGTASCGKGGGDGAGGDVSRPDGSSAQGAGRGTDDLCSLLEVAEVEAQLGERGAVADGEESGGFQCVWQIGDPTAAEYGTVYLAEVSAVGQSADQVFAGLRGATASPIDVDGVGEEAYFDADNHVLGFRTGDVVLSLQALTDPPVDDLQGKVVALADLVVDRL